MLNKKSRISFIILPIAILLAFVCAFSLRAPDNAGVQAYASSSEQQISSVDEFLNFINNINDAEASVDYLSYNYTLSADIDLNGFTLSAIGTEARPFQGQFNGNGHVISNLKINADYSNVGLFGYVGENGIVSSVGLVDASISTDYNNVGGIVGYNKGRVENCFYHGTISGFGYVGGVVGRNEGTIRNCFNNGSVSADNFAPNLGGVIGYNDGSLYSSYSIASLSYNLVSGGTSTAAIGGVIGGKGENASVPSYTFFNSSANTEIEAVGFDSGSFNTTSAVKRTRVEFNTVGMLALLNVTSINPTWSRVYTITNHSAYVAPLQAVFYNRLSDANLNDSEKKELSKKLETACSERMYGINSASDEVWGSEGNPYLITNEQQLRNFQSAVTNEGQTYFDNTFEQTRDIILTARFYPIGSYFLERRFQGTYDGGNKFINNIDISETGSENEYLGLFGYIGESATIKNLTIDGSVRGKQYIGSLVGYNYEGTIENVETTVNVSAEGNCGGVVGLSRKGKYINILSKANLNLIGTSSGGHYGVIGKYQEVVPELIQRVWYFVDIDATFISTNGMGSALVADNHNGKVSAVKSSDGTITFMASETASGYNLEFRSVDENVIENPTESTSSNAVVYGRFVKKFDKSTDSAYASLSLRGANENATYYTGQSFTLIIDIIEGTYVREVVSKNASDATIVALRPTFSYDSNNTSVIYTAVMTDDLASIFVDVRRIAFDNTIFPEKYVYNGEGVKFPVDKLDKPEGYSISVVYSGEEEPSKANQSALENYSLTVIYQNSNGVRMGSRNATFHIDKAQLYVLEPEGVLGREKEWDNSHGPTPTTVVQSGVSGIIEGDSVTVSAMLEFTHTSEVTDGYTADIKYTFSISGPDASNYIAPITQSYDGYLGKITKRNIIVSFDSYEGVFAGLNKDPSLNNKKISSQGVLSAQNYEAVYEFEAVDGQTQGAVGNYKLTVKLSDSIYQEAANYYNIQFANATDGYVVYTVKPLPVAVEYLIDGKSAESIVYDGGEHAVSAYFNNENGAAVSVNLALTKGEESVTSLVGAGEYTASVVDFTDANYDLSATATKSLIVDKAEQSAFSINSASTWEFGSNYTATTIGGSGEGAITFEVDSEYGQFDGATLTLYKAGIVTISATKASDDNYNSASATLDVEVAKGELTIVVKDVTATYMDQLNFVYETEEGVVPTGIEGVNVLINGASYNGELLDASTTPYQISIDVSNAVSDGYELVAGECGVLTINRLGVTVTPDEQTSVYGEELSELTYVVTSTATDSVLDLTLNGSLTTSAKDAGSFDVEIGDVAELNPNLDITFVEGVKYVVTPKTLIVKAKSATKQYGDSDPAPQYEVVGLVSGDTESSIELSVNVGRMSGEDSYMEGVSQSKIYNYYKISITHNSANYNANVEFESSYLTILPGVPSVASKSAINAIAGSTLSSNGNPTALIKGKVYDTANASWSEVELDGTTAWKQDATLNFKESATLVYAAVFTPSNKNFTSIEFDVELKVVPVEITVKFISNKQITYDGYDHDNVEYELTGLLPGDDAFDSISYEGDVKNAGTFKAKVSINNHNYKLIGGETTIKIVKADVSVTVEDIVITEGDTPTIAYMYFGLQRGDTEDSFKRLPSVVLPTKPGTYTLTPSGASSDNYNVSYESFEFKVLSKALSNEEGDVTLEGAFDSAVEFVMVENTNFGEVSSLYTNVQSSYANLENKEIEKVFDLKYTIDGELVTIDGTTYLTMLKPTGYEDSAVAYAIYTNNNELIYMQDIVYDGDYVTINVTNAKAIVFLAEQEDNSMMLYVAIAAVVVVVLLVVLIVSKVKKRREARYVKYHEE